MDAERVKSALNRRAEEFGRWMFPAATKSGSDLLIGSLAGEPGNSMRICVAGPKIGVFKDFATGEGGNNFIELYRQVKGCDFLTALRACAEWIGHPLSESNVAAAKHPDPAPKKRKHAGDIYQPTEEERKRWIGMSETLSGDAALCQRIAKYRGWKSDTIRNLALEGSLGYEDGRLCFLYDTGAKVRYRPQGGDRIIYWAFGKPWVWRGSFLSIPSRYTVYVTEGETDAIALLDGGAEDDPSKLVVALPSATTFDREWAALFEGKRVILCFDNDSAGEKATRRVAAALQPSARLVMRLDWEGLQRHAC